jgi:hypothetical protein
MRNRQGGNGEEADTDADGNIRRPRVKARATVITRDRKDIRTAEEKKGNNRARPSLVGGAKRSNGDRVNSSTDTKSAGPAGADKCEAVQNIQDTELDEWKEGKEAGVWGTDSVELRFGEESITEITETVGGVEEQTDAKQLQTNTVVAKITTFFSFFNDYLESRYNSVRCICQLFVRFCSGKYKKEKI